MEKHITTTRGLLAGLLEIAPKKDGRVYLNSICLNVKQEVTQWVATNGHALIVVQYENISYKPFQAILPREHIAEIVKDKTSQVTFNIDGLDVVARSGENERHFQVMDYQYPDYQRVIPNKLAPTEETYGPQFNPFLLSRLQRAFNLIEGESRNSESRFIHLYTVESGPKDRLDPAAVVYEPSLPNVVGVIMPLRYDDCSDDAEHIVNQVKYA